MSERPTLRGYDNLDGGENPFAPRTDAPDGAVLGGGVEYRQASLEPERSPFQPTVEEVPGVVGVPKEKPAEEELPAGDEVRTLGGEVVVDPTDLGLPKNESEGERYDPEATPSEELVSPSVGAQARGSSAQETSWGQYDNPFVPEDHESPSIIDGSSERR